jgi:hypothetical protein
MLTGFLLLLLFFFFSAGLLQETRGKGKHLKRTHSSRDGVTNARQQSYGGMNSSGSRAIAPVLTFQQYHHSFLSFAFPFLANGLSVFCICR